MIVFAFMSGTFRSISGLGAHKFPLRNHCFSGLDNYWQALYYVLVREK
jgi:hypothetical protein